MNLGINSQNTNQITLSDNKQLSFECILLESDELLFVALFILFNFINATLNK